VSQPATDISLPYAPNGTVIGGVEDRHTRKRLSPKKGFSCSLSDEDRSQRLTQLPRPFASRSFVLDHRPSPLTGTHSFYSMDGAAAEGGEARASSVGEEGGPPHDTMVTPVDESMTSTKAPPTTDPVDEPSVVAGTPVDASHAEEEEEEADGRDGAVAAGDDGGVIPLPPTPEHDHNDHGDATRIRRTVSDGDDAPIPPSHEPGVVVVDGEDREAAELRSGPESTTTPSEDPATAAALTTGDGDDDGGGGDDVGVGVGVADPVQVESPDPGASDGGERNEDEVAAPLQPLPSEDTALVPAPTVRDDDTSKIDPDDDEEPVDLGGASVVAVVVNEEEGVVAVDESAESLPEKSVQVEDAVVAGSDDAEEKDVAASTESRIPDDDDDDEQNELLPPSELKEEEGGAATAGDDVEGAAEGSSSVVAAGAEEFTEMSQTDGNIVEVKANARGDGGGQDDAAAKDSDPTPLNDIEPGTALGDSAPVDVAAGGALHMDSAMVESGGTVAPVKDAAGDMDPPPFDGVESGDSVDASAEDVTFRSPPKDDETVESSNVAPPPLDDVESSAFVGDIAAVGVVLSAPPKDAEIATDDSDMTPLDNVEPGTCIDVAADDASSSSPLKETAVVDSRTSFAPIDPEPSSSSLAPSDNGNDNAVGANGENDLAPSGDGDALDAVPPPTPTDGPSEMDEGGAVELAESIDGPDTDDLDAPSENVALKEAAGLPGTEGTGALLLDEKATRKRPWEDDVPPAVSGLDGIDGMTPTSVSKGAATSEMPLETSKSKKSKKEKKQKKEKKRKKEKKKKKDKKKKYKGSSISSSEYDDTSCYDSTSCDDSEAQDSDAPLIPREVHSSIQGSAVLLPPPAFDDSAEFDVVHDDTLPVAVTTPGSPKRIDSATSGLYSQKEDDARERTETASSQEESFSPGNFGDAQEEAAPALVATNEAPTDVSGTSDSVGSPVLAENSAARPEETSQSLTTASAQVPAPIETDLIQRDASEAVSSVTERLTASRPDDSLGNDDNRDRSPIEPDIPAARVLLAQRSDVATADLAREECDEVETPGPTINEAEILLANDAVTSEPDCESRAAGVSAPNELDRESNNTAGFFESADEMGCDDDRVSKLVVPSPLDEIDSESGAANALLGSAESDAALNGESSAAIEQSPQSHSVPVDAETQSKGDLVSCVESPAELTSAHVAQQDSENSSPEALVSDTVNNRVVIADETEPTADTNTKTSKNVEPVDRLDADSKTANSLAVDAAKPTDPDYETIERSHLDELDSGIHTADTFVSNVENAANLDDESNLVVDESPLDQLDLECDASDDGIAAEPDGKSSQLVGHSDLGQQDPEINAKAHTAVEPDGESNQIVEHSHLGQQESEFNAEDTFVANLDTAVEPESESSQLVEHSPQDQPDSEVNAEDTFVANLEAAVEPDSESSQLVDHSSLDQPDAEVDAEDTFVGSFEAAAGPDGESSTLVERPPLDQSESEVNAVGALLSNTELAAGPDGESSRLVEVTCLDQPDSERIGAETSVCIAEQTVKPDGETKQLVENVQGHSPTIFASGPKELGSQVTDESLLDHDVSTLDEYTKDTDVHSQAVHGSRSIETPSEARAETTEVAAEVSVKADQLEQPFVEGVEPSERSQDMNLEAGDRSAAILVEPLQSEDHLPNDIQLEKPTMLVLVSNHALKREVVANQQMAFTILSARKIPYETIDGSLTENQKRRNELFELSGLRGQYPQFFKLSQLEAKDPSVAFYGDWDQFQWANECGTLVQDFAPAGDGIEKSQESQEALIDGNDGGNTLPLSIPGSDSKRPTNASNALVSTILDSAVEAIDAPQIRDAEEARLSAASGDLPDDVTTAILPQEIAVVAPCVNQGSREEPVRAGRRSPIPPKKAVQVPAAFRDPVATEGTETEPKPLGSTSPIPLKRSVVVPAVFGGLVDQRLADEVPRRAVDPSPKPTKKPVVVPAAFGGYTSVESLEGTEERSRRTGRSSPIPSKKAVVVPAAFGGTTAEERENEKEPQQLSRSSPIPRKKALVVPTAFGGPKPSETTSDVDPGQLSQCSPVLRKKKAVSVPAAFSNVGGQATVARASPIPLKKSNAVLAPASRASRTLPDSGDGSAPTTGTRKFIVSGAFGGDKSRIDTRAPGSSTPSCSPSSENLSGFPLPFAGKEKQFGKESAASPTQVRRALVFPNDGFQEPTVGESRPEPNAATQSTPKKLAIPTAFSSPDSNPQNSMKSPLKHFGSVTKQSKLPMPSAFSESRALDQSGGTSTTNPDSKLDSLSHRGSLSGSAHSRTDTKTKLFIPAAFGGGARPSDSAVKEVGELAMKSSSDHMASSFSSPSKKLSIPSAFGSRPASRSTQPMLSQSMHSTPTKKFPVPAVSAVRGSPAASSTSDGSDERQTHRDVATNSLSVPAPSLTGKKRLQIPAAFGHPPSLSNPIPPVASTPPKLRAFGSTERSGDGPLLGASGDYAAAAESTPPPKDPLAVADPSPFRRKVAIPDAFGKTSSHGLSSSSHHSASSKPSRPSVPGVGLSASSHHRAATATSQAPSTIASGTPSKIGNPRSSSIPSSAPSLAKYVTVGDTVMTRAAAAAFAAHEDSLMTADDSDTGDIPMVRRSLPPGRRSSATSSSSSPTPAAPKRKVAIPAAFLGGGAPSQP
jgi:hypothetical protein